MNTTKTMKKIAQNVRPNPTAKKQSLVEAIKRNFNQEFDQNPKNGNLKNSKPSFNDIHYQSLKNTAIDYEKDHDINYNEEYYMNQEGDIDPYDQTTAQFGQKNHHPQQIIQEISPQSLQDNNYQYDQDQNQNGIDTLYDQNIMNQIQMELYGDQNNNEEPLVTNKPSNQQQKLSKNKRNLPQNKQSETKSKPVINAKEKNQKINPNNQKPKNKLQNLSSSPKANSPVNQIGNKNSKETQKKNNQVLQKDTSNHLEQTQQSLQIPTKTLKNTKANGISNIERQLTIPSSQPTKRINKTDPQKNLQSINFNLMIKPFPGAKPAKRVIRCLSDNNQIQDRSQARFLIELMNGQQVQMSNTEMVYLYKDILVDYYQGIHFS